MEGFKAGKTSLKQVELEELGDVVTALISAGMKLEFLREFPFSAYDALHFPVEQIGPDQYALPGSPGTIPFMYSIRATG